MQQLLSGAPERRRPLWALVVAAAILYPPFGARRGIKAILSLSGVPWRRPRGGKYGLCMFSETRTLRDAASAGALCMVVRTRHWKPEPGDKVFGALIQPNAHQQQSAKQEYAAGSTEEHTGAGIGNETAKSPDVQIATYIPPWSLSETSNIFHTRSWTPVGGRAVHGQTKYSPEYALAIVPRFAKVRSTNSATEVSLSYNIVKIIISLVQTLYSITTLYRSRGNQITQYGYAAFGLTVAPYAVMSVVNLFGSFCTADYPRLYIVRSSVMDEAIQRHKCEFSGAIGELEEIESDLPLERLHSTDLFSSSGPVDFQEAGANNVTARFDSPDHTHQIRNVWCSSQAPDKDFPKATILVPSCGICRRDGHEDKDVLDSMKIINTVPYIRDTASLFYGWLRAALGSFLSFLVPCLPIMINGIISHFQPGNSTSAQRGWTMSWLVCTIALGPGVESAITTHLLRGNYSVIDWIAVAFGILMYSAPAIGGFIVVGQMLHDFGVCVRIA